jgi:two-component system alkaline phosphatase synthesis response regulator PhoP
MNAHVLLMEDAERLRIALTDRLREEGCTVDSVTDGDAAFEKIVSEPFDMLILGLRLSGRNVLDLCRDIRVHGIKTPILLLTAHSTTEEKVTALRLGADAYVTKPIDMGELLARTEALLRRTPAARSYVRNFGSIRVDLIDSSVTRDGVPLRLSTQEFRLLSYFVRHSGVLLSREQILRDVWGYDVDSLTRTVDVHVASLRYKLEVDPKRPNLIRTVRRMGYRFETVNQPF